MVVATSDAVVDEGGAQPRWRASLRTVLLAAIGFLVVGNALIMGAMAWFRMTTTPEPVPSVAIDNFAAVDDRVYRSAAPERPDYLALADIGVTTVVDLRAEAGLEDVDAASDAGLDRVSLPIRDGQLPSAAQVERFLAVVDDAPGAVLLHCGAGVGRTGAMAAYYLNATGQTSGTEALRRNLAVGPPSLEQIVFSVGTANGDYRRPGVAVTVASRILDGPRRIWHNVV